MSNPLDARPRVVLASLSGESDAAWARQGAAFADLAMLGGIAIDDDSRAAARQLVERDRSEFLPPDPVAFVTSEIESLSDTDIGVGVNVRSATVGPIRPVASVCAAHDALFEVNAHCRQAELCAVGCGETLLCDTDRLCRYVRAAVDEGATVSVKVRAEVDGVDLAKTASRLSAAGASMLHVDAMDSEWVIRDVADAAPDLYVVANNGVRDVETVEEYFRYGADAVSVGRPSTDRDVLRRVRDAVDAWFAVEPDL